MSDDLVYRLRDAYSPSASGVLPPRILYVYAADEIDRLRRRVADLEEFLRGAAKQFNEAAKT